MKNNIFALPCDFSYDGKVVTYTIDSAKDKERLIAFLEEEGFTYSERMVTISRCEVMVELGEEE